MIVERTDFITVPVTDMERSKQFYGETLALRVADVAEAKAKLEAAGVQVNDMWDSGLCRGAGTRDPSGNPILLHRRYAPYPDGSKP